MVDPVDETYRRTVTRQLNIGESRHALARKILHGNRGEIAQAYRAGQEDQLGALGLVFNAVVLWNTRYIDLAVNLLPPKATRYVTRTRPASHRWVRAHQHAGPLQLPQTDRHPAAACARDPDTQEQ